MKRLLSFMVALVFVLNTTFFVYADTVYDEGGLSYTETEANDFITKLVFLDPVSFENFNTFLNENAETIGLDMSGYGILTTPQQKFVYSMIYMGGYSWSEYVGNALQGVETFRTVFNDAMAASVLEEKEFLEKISAMTSVEDTKVIIDNNKELLKFYGVDTEIYEQLFDEYKYFICENLMGYDYDEMEIFQDEFERLEKEYLFLQNINECSHYLEIGELIYENQDVLCLDLTKYNSLTENYKNRVLKELCGQYFISLAEFEATFYDVINAVIDSSQSSGSSGGGSSTGGGGSSMGGGSSTIVTVPAGQSLYTAKGIISLPEPTQETVDVYCAFGGVTLEVPSLASELVETTELEAQSTEAVWEQKDSEIDYTKEKLVATIPAGQTQVEYEVDFSILTSYTAFYGQFRTDSDEFSNKRILSSVVFLSDGITEYTLDVSLEKAEIPLSCQVSMPENTALSADAELYIILEGTYDKYIKKVNIPAQNTEWESKTNLSAGEYTISYYIPESKSMDLQRLKKGLFTYSEKIIISENVQEVTFGFELQKAKTVSGTVYLPDGETAEDVGGVNLIIYAVPTYSADNANSVNCAILQGENSVDYTLALEEDEEYEISVSLNKNIYYTGDIMSDLVTSGGEDVTGYDCILRKVYPVHGTVYVPDDIEMTEDTYFYTYVYLENLTNGEIYLDVITINDTDRCGEYLIQNLPEVFEETDDFILYYNFDDVSEMPSSPYNPVVSYRKTSGGSGGGGSSSGSGSSSGGSGLNYEMPSGLVQKRNFYIKSDGTVTTKKDEAGTFNLTGIGMIKDLTLAKEEEVKLYNTLGGYFTSAISVLENIPLTVSLVNTADNSEQSQSFDFSGETLKYIFETETDGDYILKYKLGDEIFYYSNNRLVSDINSAAVITLSDKAAVYKKDVWYRNSFRTNAYAYCTNDDLSGNLEVYDILGNKVAEAKSDKAFYIPVTPFVLGYDGKYFSEFKFDENEYTYKFSELTDSFDEAYIASCEYRDYFTEETMGEFIINISEKLDFDIMAEGSWIDEGNYKTATKTGSVIEITSPEELAWVAYKSATDENRSSFSGLTVKLMNDIDLSEHFWFPIGGADLDGAENTEKAFCGTFDGNGYTIKGLTIGTQDEPAEYVNSGLIGYAQGATVKNLKMEDVFVNSIGYSGAVLGEGNAKIDSVTVSGYITGGGYAGGIAGYTYSDILNSISYTVVSAYDYYDYTGCIAGYSKGYIENCGAYGSIANTDSQYSGGIVGHTYWDNRIKNCISDVSGAVYAISRGAYGAQNCIYNSSKSESYANGTSDEAIVYPMTAAEIYSKKSVELLNNNANEDWFDWTLNEKNIPVVTNKKSTVWSSDGISLTETDGIYTVTNAKELAWISEQVNSGVDFSEKTVKLVADIDLSGKYWIPIGNEEEGYYFAGNFDGQEYTIKGLKIKSDKNRIGLFGATSDGSVKNVNITDADVSGNVEVGILAGYAISTDFENCMVSGTVKAESGVGGVLGYSDRSTLKKVSFVGTVSGSGSEIGGLIGNSYSCEIAYSSANADITGNSEVGGITGHCYGYGLIENCYFKGNITGTKNIGGLIGYESGSIQITDCYSDCNLYGGATVGGLIGYTDGITKTNSFWNSDKEQFDDGFESAKDIGSETEEDATRGITSLQLADKSTFTDWDFDTVWTMDKNTNTPVLSWQIKPIDYSLSDVNLIGNVIALNVTKNITNSDTNKIMYAKYVDGVLVDFIQDDLRLDKETKLVYSSRGFKETDLQGEVTYKVFVWDIANMKSLSESAKK